MSVSNNIYLILMNKQEDEMFGKLSSAYKPRSEKVINYDKDLANKEIKQENKITDKVTESFSYNIEDVQDKEYTSLFVDTRIKTNNFEIRG